MRHVLVAVLAVLGLGSRVAAADVAGLPDIEPGLPDRAGLPDPSAHAVFGFGVDLGRAPTGSMVGYGGVHGLTGVRFGRLAALAEVDAMVLDSTRGNTAVLGYGLAGRLEARLAVWRGRVEEKRRRGPPKALVRGELWIEPAIGYEDASQASGDRLARPAVSFAIGYQQTRHEADAWNGSYLALRASAALDPSGPMGTQGGRDLGILVTSGVIFGR